MAAKMVLTNVAKGFGWSTLAVGVPIGVSYASEQMRVQHSWSPYFPVGCAFVGAGLAAPLVFARSHPPPVHIFALPNLIKGYTMAVGISFLMYQGSHAVIPLWLEQLKESGDIVESKTHKGVYESSQMGSPVSFPDGTIVVLQKAPESFWQFLKYYFKKSSTWDENMKEAVVKHELGHRETANLFWCLNALCLTPCYRAIMYSKSFPMLVGNIVVAPFFIFMSTTVVSWASEFTADMRAGHDGLQLVDYLNTVPYGIGPGGHPPTSIRRVAYEIGDDVYKVVGPVLYFVSRFVTLKFLYDDPDINQRAEPCSLN
eukprot:m.31388 g.31388  ORF g.31388 m.31388 type:complete len:314 (+) comp8311_c0_seq2:300-1241(+)